MITDDEIKNGIYKALEDAFIFIDSNETENIELTSYIEDSIQFMSLIVYLEDNFKIDFPPELLLFENFKHINDVYNIIYELKNKKDNIV